MNRPFIVTEAWLRRRYLVQMIFSALIGAGLLLLVQEVRTPADVADARMEKFCRWPSKPGEAMFAGLDREGVLNCWDMRQ